MADELKEKKPDLGSGSSSVSAPKQAPTPKMQAPKQASAPAPKASTPKVSSPAPKPETSKRGFNVPDKLKPGSSKVDLSKGNPNVAKQYSDHKKTFESPVAKQPGLGTASHYAKKQIDTPKVDFANRRKIVNQGFGPKNVDKNKDNFNWHDEVVKKPELIDVDIVSMMEQDPDKYDYDVDLEKKDYKSFEPKFNNLRNDLYNKMISGEGDNTFTPEEANQVLDSWLGTLDEHKQAMGYKENPQQQDFVSPSEQKIENEDKFQKQRATDYLKEKYSSLNSIMSDKELDDAFDIVQNYGLNKQDLENAGLNILANQLFNSEDESTEREKASELFGTDLSANDHSEIYNKIMSMSPEERKGMLDYLDYAHNRGDIPSSEYWELKKRIGRGE